MEQQQKPEQEQDRFVQEEPSPIPSGLLRAYIHGGGEELTEMLLDVEDRNEYIGPRGEEHRRPQHVLRVNEAREAYYKKTRSLASAAALFLDDYSQGIEEMVSKEADYDPRIREHWTELQSLYWSYRQKQDEFLRVVANSAAGELDS